MSEPARNSDQELLDWLDSNFVKIELGSGMAPIFAIEDLRAAIMRGIKGERSAPTRIKDNDYS